MPETTAPTLVDEIVEQRARVVAAQEDVHAQTKVLAELLARTRTDPEVSLAAAARAMGVTKGYAHQLVTKLDEGKL